MREVLIDGNEMTTKILMHDYLKEQFLLPYYYTRNLDSLYQILVKETDQTHITVINKDKIAAGYGSALVLLFKDLSVKNPNFIVDFE